MEDRQHIRRIQDSKTLHVLKFCIDGRCDVYHHLLSEKANLTDPELIKLQKNILKTQAQEIELMKRKLKELEENK